jgi:glycosyltransferase involved in cell wall biosynthesis
MRVADTGGFEESFRWASRVLTPSQYVADRVIATGEIQPDRVRVLYDGVDTTFFAPEVVDGEAARSHHDIPRTASVVLTVARFVAQKRHDLLLRAFAIVASTKPEAVLVMVGDAGDEPATFESILRLIDELALRERVRVLDFQSDIRPLQALADVSVLCSDREALGLTILEAMSLAKPIVVTDSSGNREAVLPDITGTVVPRSEDALAAAILEFLNNPDTARRFGAEGRRRAIEVFDSKLHGRRLMELYTELSN